MALLFKILPSVHRRGLYYAKKDIVRAIERSGLTYVVDGIFLTVEVNTVQERKELERNLALVDSRVSYHLVTKGATK